jgi:3-deoxy-manno-octulosonate cytidylyltransferase (CMP-KDO synthetase)
MLLDIHGRPLIEHAWRRARHSGASQVVIATDDERIASAARGFGAEVQMTASSHPSGSDRIAECARLSGWPQDRIVVNLQGDEPLMPARCLDQVADLLARHPGADVATLYAPIEDPLEVNDPNAVKVVARHDSQAVYFSRSAIPFARDHETAGEAMAAGIHYRRHLGIYAYRRSALEWFVNTPPTPLERAEKLEQLRFLECGRRIVVARAAARIPAGVDTRNDLERVRAALAADPENPPS